MISKLIPFALLFALASCGNREQKAPKKDTTYIANPADPNAPPEPADAALADRTDTTKLFKEYSTKHYFSDLKYKDTFSLKLYGDDLLTSNTLLEIKSAQSRLIYRYLFSNKDLMIDPKSVTKSEQTTRINEILKHYFDEKNFKSPAISSKQTFEDAFANPNVANRADWQKIKADKQSILFRHREGYEGQAEIAYSKAINQAMLVSYSD